MITVEQAMAIHDVLIENFGGAKGTRDIGSLESALSRPFQTFDGNELYPNPIDKAAAIFESLINNHPFIDGNKRTAYVIMQLVLLEFNIAIKASQEEKYDFVIASSQGKLKFIEIKKWLESHQK